MHNAPMGAVILIGLGLIFLLDNFGLFPMFHFWRLWPVLLVALGLRIAYRRTHGRA